MQTKEGFYKLEFVGVAGTGVGVLALDSGMVVGADAARCGWLPFRRCRRS